MKVSDQKDTGWGWIGGWQLGNTGGTRDGAGKVRRTLDPTGRETGPWERPHTLQSLGRSSYPPVIGLGRLREPPSSVVQTRAHSQGVLPGLPRSPETHNPDWDSNPPSFLKDTFIIYVFMAVLDLPCREAFALAAASRACSLLRCAASPSRWLPLPRRGSRAHGLP